MFNRVNWLDLMLRILRKFSVPAFAVRQVFWLWFSSTLLEVLDCWASSSSPSRLAGSTSCPCRPGSWAMNFDWCHWISIVGNFDWTLWGSSKRIWLMIYEVRRECKEVRLIAIMCLFLGNWFKVWLHHLIFNRIIWTILQFTGKARNSRALPEALRNGN